MVGRDPPPIHYTALLGMKAKELNLPQLTFGEQWEMLRDLTLQENARETAAKAKADKEEAQKILGSTKARPTPKPSTLAPPPAAAEPPSEPQPRAEEPKEARSMEEADAHGDSRDSDSSPKAAKASQPRADSAGQQKKKRP